MATKVGSDILVNSASDTDDLMSPQVAALSGGGFIETWVDVTDPNTPTWAVEAQIFNSSGAPQLGTVLSVASSVDDSITSVIGLADNAFLVSWDNHNVPEQEAQLFDSSGAVHSSQIDTATTGGASTAVRLTGGGFAIIWENPDAGGAHGGISGEVFAADGTPDSTNGVFSFGTGGASFAVLPAIAALSGGGFVVSWSYGIGGDNVFAQRFNADGTKVGAQITLSTEGGPESGVAALASGAFVVTWDEPHAIKAQLFDGSGNTVGSPITVDTNGDGVTDTGNFEGTPAIATLGNGQFVVCWIRLHENVSPNTASVHGQVFNADGTKSGGVFTVATNGSAFDDQVSVAALGDHQFVVTWAAEGTNGDDSNNTIHAQIFSATNAATANPDTHAVLEYAATSGNVITGTTGGDVADSDTGGTLAVTAITGANGAGTVGAALVGAKGTLTIHADGSYSYVADHTQPLAVGTQVHDTFTYTIDDGNGNTANATLTITVTGVATGTPGSDWLVGGAGNETLDGKGGLDTLTGGSGKDTFLFDTGPLNAHTNLAHITNFSHGDKIALSGHIFESKVGHHFVPIKVNAQSFYAAPHATKAHTAADRIIYNKTTGALYFDPDGTGHLKPVEFAVLDNHPALTIHDFVVIG